MTTREWLEELTGHVRGGHVVRNDDAARLLDLLQRMRADVQGNWEAWQAALARADRAEAALAMMQSEMNKIARNLGKEIELLARAETAEAALAQCQHERDTLANRLEQAEAALAALQTPCMWTVDGQGWFVSQCDGNLRRKNGKFCPACGHPVEVAP